MAATVCWTLYQHPHQNYLAIMRYDFARGKHVRRALVLHLVQEISAKLFANIHMGYLIIFIIFSCRVSEKCAHRLERHELSKVAEP